MAGECIAGNSLANVAGRWFLIVRIAILLVAVLGTWFLVRTPTPRPAPDNLFARMQAAYTADPAPPDLKNLQRTSLVGLYQAMAIRARKQVYVTTTDLLEAMRDSATDLLEEEKDKPTALIQVRKEVVAGELVAALGTDPEAKLDPHLRPKAIETYNRLAQSLGGVK